MVTRCDAGQSGKGSTVPKRLYLYNKRSSLCGNNDVIALEWVALLGILRRRYRLLPRC